MAFRGLLDSITGALCVFGFCKPRETKAKIPPKTSENLSDDSDIGSSLRDVSERVVKEFEFTGGSLRRAVKGFIQQLDNGLMKHGSDIEQLPSFITRVPTGQEQGTYLVVDLGGTNLRVCSVNLHGDSTHSMIQSKCPIPGHLMVSGSSKGLFNFVARKVRDFLQLNYPTYSTPSTGRTTEQPLGDVISLGFTFSHAIEQLNISSGNLIRWSKGFDIDGVIGQDVCLLLQRELDELQLPVRVSALINDTVGTLMARSYASPNSAHTILGAVFGTGTNGAYVEQLSKISKLADSKIIEGGRSKSDGLMIVNTEWGNFDQKLEYLPNTSYDKLIDAESINPGFEMYEKRISGMYLGEILRVVILSLVKDPQVAIFLYSKIPESSRIFIPWAIGSEFMSMLAGDASEQLVQSRRLIKDWLEVDDASEEDARAVKVISQAIGNRSARLSAVALGAVVLQTDSLMKCSGGSVVDIGVDGSLIEMYPGFIDEIRGAFMEIHEIGVEGEKKIEIAISKDGSGVGAALTAHVASIEISP